MWMESFFPSDRLDCQVYSSIFDKPMFTSTPRPLHSVFPDPIPCPLLTHSPCLTSPFSPNTCHMSPRHPLSMLFILTCIDRVSLPLSFLSHSHTHTHPCTCDVLIYHVWSGSSNMSKRSRETGFVRRMDWWGLSGRLTQFTLMYNEGRNIVWLILIRVAILLLNNKTSRAKWQRQRDTCWSERRLQSSQVSTQLHLSTSTIIQSPQGFV